jgi:hypothetical protein
MRRTVARVVGEGSAVDGDVKRKGVKSSDHRTRLDVADDCSS